MRYLASVVTQCFTAFGELLALHKRFVELSGGVSRCRPACTPLMRMTWLCCSPALLASDASACCSAHRLHSRALQSRVSGLLSHACCLHWSAQGV